MSQFFSIAQDIAECLILNRNVDNRYDLKYPRRSGKSTGILSALFLTCYKPHSIRVTYRNERVMNEMKQLFTSDLGDSSFDSVVTFDYYRNNAYNITEEFDIEIYDDWELVSKSIRSSIENEMKQRINKCKRIHIYTPRDEPCLSCSS